MSNSELARRERMAKRMTDLQNNGCIRVVDTVYVQMDIHTAIKIAYLLDRTDDVTVIGELGWLRDVVTAMRQEDEVGVMVPDTDRYTLSQVGGRIKLGDDF